MAGLIPEGCTPADAKEDQRGEPACPDCGGTGEIFGHADDCADDACALNGDMHSCDGKLEKCGTCDLIRELDAAGSAALPPPPPESAHALPIYSGWLWTHKQRGGEYRMIGTAQLQTDKPLRDMAEVVLYQGEDDRLWARAAEEWDGRFKRLRPDPAFAAACAAAVPHRESDSTRDPVDKSPESRRSAVDKTDFSRKDAAGVPESDSIGRNHD